MKDRLLIWQFKRGSREALRRIYDKYHKDLLKLAIVLTGQLDTAEDVVQNVFVRLAQSADRISLSGSLRSYLTTSTVNRVRNLRRDRLRHKTRSLTDEDACVSTERVPDQWAVLSEQLERLSQAMHCLPYEQREVISLHIHADMTFRQIASLQKTTISTVHARYRYGLEKLRSLLNHEVHT